MKLFYFLLLLITLIEYVQSKNKVLRTYTIRRDNILKVNQLSAYTVFDKSEKVILYQLKPTSTDIDAIVVTDYPAKNMIANLEGEWIAKIFNVTFSIHDKKLDKWIDGTITTDPSTYNGKYYVKWNSKYLNTKGKFFSSKVVVHSTASKELLADFGNRDWINGANIRFALKIYSNQIPDSIFFFLVAINDHRLQEGTAD